jgi:hypothetical protein
MNKNILKFLIESEEKIAIRIAKEHPEIAQDYRRRVTQREIIINHNLLKNYFPPNATIKIAMNTIGKSLRLLIPKTELSKLEEKIKKDGAEMGGKRTYFLKVGIQDENYGYKERIRATLKGLESRGVKPFKKSEKKMLHAMAYDDRYKHQTGNKKGYPNYKKIQESLKQIFGYERTQKAIGKEMRRIKNST